MEGDFSMEYTVEQQEVVDLLRKQLELGKDGENVIIAGQGGVGKAQPDSTMIPTPNGFRRLDSLQVNDYVFDLTGNPTRILGVFPQGIKDCYQITFSDGRTALSCDEHLWTTLTSKGNFKVRALKEMIPDYMGKDKRGFNTYKYKIPAGNFIQYSTKHFEIDPYVIGCFLGDGCCLEDYLTISSNDKDLVVELERLTGISARKNPAQNYSWTFGTKLTRVYFKDVPELINYSYNKTIPEQYMYGDFEQRLALLQGLLDTDGSARKDRNSATFTSTSLGLIEQVQELVWSLGGHAGRIQEDQRDSCYFININAPKELLARMFRLQRKIDVVLNSPPTRTRFDQLTIHEIKYVGQCSMRCIKVDNELEIYRTEQYIPTHNTAMMCEFISELLEEGKYVIVAALTGKATGVIRSKLMATIKEKGIALEEKQLRIETLTRLTKRSIPIMVTSYGETKFVNQWRKPKESTAGYDVLFIDELSMVPEYIMRWWKESEIRVFGFGDYCQLPEVITADTYKEVKLMEDVLHMTNKRMTYGYGVKALKGLSQASLTTVLRSDNDIALLCGDLRDFSMSKSKVVEVMKQWAAKSDDIEYSDNINDLEVGKDWQIISYTNKKCQEVNNQLALGQGYPDPEDKIILFDNLNSFELYNGDVILFKDFMEKCYQKMIPAQNANDLVNNRGTMSDYVIMKWQGRMPALDSPHPTERYFAYVKTEAEKVLKLVSMEREQRMPEIMAHLCENGEFGTEMVREEVRNKWLELKRNTKLTFEMKFKQIMDFLEDRALFPMINALIKELPKLPSVSIVNADYGMCCTTHRSQGSEYPKVCYLFERFDRPLLYTGLSRAKEKLKIINLTKTT